MDILYQDKRIIVAVKPAGVLSTDEPGGMPTLLRAALGDENACIRTVHRLDAAVGGLMVYARSVRAAAILSEQIRTGAFHKEYLAVVHGRPEAASAELRDLLCYDGARRMSRVVTAPGRGVQEAVLDYSLAASDDELSLLRVRLHTGRTHQIREHTAAIGHPLAGDTTYGGDRALSRPALHSARCALDHPFGRGQLAFSEPLPEDMRVFLRERGCSPLLFEI